MNSEATTGNKRQESHLEGVPEWLVVVRTQVESLKFGTVLITVHDSNIVQIERLEKTRLDQNKQQR